MHDPKNKPLKKAMRTLRKDYLPRSQKYESSKRWGIGTVIAKQIPMPRLCG
jgi:hypothetical protein